MMTGYCHLSRLWSHERISPTSGETRRQRPGSGEQHLFVGLVPGEAQSVAETAIQHESHVVVVGRIFFAFDARGCTSGRIPKPSDRGCFHTRTTTFPEKSAAPPARIRRNILAVLPRAAGGLRGRCTFRPSAAPAARPGPAPRPRPPPAVFPAAAAANSADSPIHSNIFFIVLYF